jgi:integrase
MRRGEAVGLKWSDLDRASGRVSVRRTVQSLAGRAVEFDVKTRRSQRCVNLGAATITELDRWRRRLRLDGLPHGPDDWMFCKPDGTVPQPRIAQSAVRPDRAAYEAHPDPLSRPAPNHASLLVANNTSYPA